MMTAPTTAADQPPGAATMPKTPFHTRLSADALRLMKAIADAKGITLTAVLEIAVRELAKKEHIG